MTHQYELYFKDRSVVLRYRQTQCIAFHPYAKATMKELRNFSQDLEQTLTTNRRIRKTADLNYIFRVANRHGVPSSRTSQSSIQGARTKIIW